MAARPLRFPQSALPGRGLTLGFTLTYLSLIVLIPLAAVFFKTAELGLSGFWDILSRPRVLNALWLSFSTAFAAALINVVFGVVVAWVFVRYSFPGKRLLDAFIDLPFALPTAVAGIALTGLYAGNGWVGQSLEPLGIQVAFAPLGIVVALTFIGLPFVVRTVQPVLADAESAVEEAAASLGATRRQTSGRSRSHTSLKRWPACARSGATGLLASSTVCWRSTPLQTALKQKKFLMN